VKPVRPVWRQQGDQFGFRARDESRFVAGGRGSGGWFGEFAGGEFAGRLPPRDQYEFGRGHSLESRRGYGPYFPYRGSRTPPMRRECRMDLPGPTNSVGTRTDYSVGPWDYSTCAARYLMA
jgi:hypothetical protein